MDPDDQGSLNNAKKRVCSEHGLSALPRNSDLLSVCTRGERERLRELLKLKPVRTISGVAVVAVMTSPAPCPHGTCVPCPGGPESGFGTPQSYLGREPATMRAIEKDYDPYQQVSHRLEQLWEIGHDVDKAELILMGGTLPSRSLCYQEWFVRRCLEAMNEFQEEPIGGWKSLEEVQRANEAAGVRNVGMTFETRPDWAKQPHVDGMLRLGATKVEIGVQSIYDDVLRLIRRGHDVEDVVEANQILRDSGLKVGFHVMPGLPDTSTQDDVDMFRELFQDSRFKPDYLKIYPTLITEGSNLYEWYLRGQYRALDEEEAADLIARAKSHLPPWVRLQRVQRDIPAPMVVAGVRKSNIRQLAQNRLDELGGRCECIRCREVGHKARHGVEPDAESIKLKTIEYEACDGQEYFISYEDSENDVLVGFVRLRYPGEPHRAELRDAAIVRELHVYGSMAPLSEEGEWQHRGYGEQLMQAAEERARSAGYARLAVMSGIGVREYYHNLGYTRDGPYMIKKLG